ncbi:hypothetical protein DRN69_02055 [Candidatus Pacearchaeota archaeon]|nr:MAG: hypothetical protein DRN69_02055 [Candidatus Pacearchaeota archaeon]
MVKKTKETIIPKKKKVASKNPLKKSSEDTNIQKILVENFVSLQKVMVNLSVKFDDLTNKISKLLELFEISAKALAEKDFDFGKSSKDNKKIIEKIDTLLEQNKTIARGLALMHDRIPQEHPQQLPPPVEEMPPEKSITSEYQKSMPLEHSQDFSKPGPRFRPLPKR